MDNAVEKIVRLTLEGGGPTSSREGMIDLWNSLTHEQKRQTAESRVFVRFAAATGLGIDPFKHDNEAPPKPDIRTVIDGHDYYFELGEVVDERLAINIRVAQKTRAVFGCTLSQVDPLAKMLKEKCEKQYEADGKPLDLLLYYWRQGSYRPTVDQYLEENHQAIQESLRSSQFRKIWIYDWSSDNVLAEIEAESRSDCYRV